MTAGEWITVIGIVVGVILTVLGGAATTIGGLIWWFVTRDVRRFETGMDGLSKVVSEATIEMRELKVEVKNIHDDHRNIWGEINRIKDHQRSTRDTWRADEEKG